MLRRVYKHLVILVTMVIKVTKVDKATKNEKLIINCTKQTKVDFKMFSAKFSNYEEALQWLISHAEPRKFL